MIFNLKLFYSFYFKLIYLKIFFFFLDDERHIKLADFGLSKEGVKNEDYTKSFCGSPIYLCPEMLLNKGSSKKSDIYGIGILF